MEHKRFNKLADKRGFWLLKSTEDTFAKTVIPHLPPWLETYHLTLATFLWIGFILLGGYLSIQNIHYLWLMSFGVFAQAITDRLDGEVGRYRNTGLIKWGFYMDHFLDYLFLCAIVISYWFLTPYEYKYILFVVLAISAAYFVHVILYFGATGQLELAKEGFGPSEFRVLVIIINTMLIFLDRIIFVPLLLIFFGLNIFYLVINIYRAQKKIWDIDMKLKHQHQKTSHNPRS
jgi:phosphatidylglycerophosphate synthase